MSRRRRKRIGPERGPAPTLGLNAHRSSGTTGGGEIPHVDTTVLTLVLILVALGTLMVYSASSAVAETSFGDSAWYLKRHLVRVAIGVIVMLVLARARYARMPSGARR